VERTAEEMVIARPPERCFSVAIDVERYPEWVADVKQVDVLERDSDGRPVVVAFRAGAFGRSTNYVLGYDFSLAPSEFSWTQRQGDITNRLDGRYTFTETGDGDTLAHYELSVDLRVPIPGFVRRRAEGLILHAAMRDLKIRVESLE
jgi:hypothetical protein